MGAIYHSSKERMLDLVIRFLLGSPSPGQGDTGCSSSRHKVRRWQIRGALHSKSVASDMESLQTAMDSTWTDLPAQTEEKRIPLILILLLTWCLQIRKYRTSSLIYGDRTNVGVLHLNTHTSSFLIFLNLPYLYSQLCYSLTNAVHFAIRTN